MPRPIACAVFVSLFFAAFAAAQQTGKEEDRQRKEALVNRQEQLIRTLKRGRHFDTLRAAEELAAMDGLDPLVTRDLVALIQNPPERARIVFGSARLVDSLAASGSDGVPVILRALRSGKGRGEDVLLLSLGRMGPAARAAVPFLRERLKDPRTEAHVKADLRVVLANIAADPKDGVWADEMLSGALLRVRPRQWLKREVIDKLVKELREMDQKLEGDSLLYAAEFLGVLGDRAAAAIPILERAQKEAIKEQKNVAIAATLALARIDPKNQEQALRRLFKGSPHAFRALERVTILGILTEIPYLLVDSRMSRLLARLVEDKDREVAEGAAAILWWAGLAGRDAFPRLLKYVRSDAAPARRAIAANVLGRVATFARLAELEVARKEQKSDVVRGELQAAIGDIRSLGKEGWDKEYLSRRYPLKLWP